MIEAGTGRVVVLVSRVSLSSRLGAGSRIKCAAKFASHPFDYLWLCGEHAVCPTCDHSHESYLTTFLSADGRVACLSYANDLHIALDGVIYFSDSTVIAPVLNKQGFYDTLMGYVLTQLQVSQPIASQLASAKCLYVELLWSCAADVSTQLRTYQSLQRQCGGQGSNQTVERK